MASGEGVHKLAGLLADVGWQRRAAADGEDLDSVGPCLFDAAKEYMEKETLLPVPTRTSRCGTTSCRLDSPFCFWH